MNSLPNPHHTDYDTIKVPQFSAKVLTDEPIPPMADVHHVILTRRAVIVPGKGEALIWVDENGEAHGPAWFRNGQVVDVKLERG